MVLDRKLELEAKVGRATTAHNDAAFLEEALQLRKRFLRRELAEHFLILGRNGPRRRGPAATAATTARSHPLYSALNRDVRREDDHVVLRLEVAGVDVLWIDDRIRNLELLELVARPAGRHRAAVAIDQRDPLRRQLDSVTTRTSGRTIEAQSEVRR